jgi:hypothetical protein
MPDLLASMRSLLNLINLLLADLRRRHSNRHPKHDWKYRSDEYRVCAVCDRHEEWDCGGGMASPVWVRLESGNPSAHVKLKTVAANAALPSSKTVSPIEEDAAVTAD